MFMLNKLSVLFCIGGSSLLFHGCIELPRFCRIRSFLLPVFVNWHVGFLALVISLSTNATQTLIAFVTYICTCKKRVSEDVCQKQYSYGVTQSCYYLYSTWCYETRKHNCYEWVENTLLLYEPFWVWTIYFLCFKQTMCTFIMTFSWIYFVCRRQWF